MKLNTVRFYFFQTRIMLGFMYFSPVSCTCPTSFISFTYYPVNGWRTIKIITGHVLSSGASGLVSWVRIPLQLARARVCFVRFCIGRGLQTDPSPIQGFLLSVYTHRSQISEIRKALGSSTMV